MITDLLAFAVWWGGIWGTRKAGYSWYDSITWPFTFGIWLAYEIFKQENK